MSEILQPVVTPCYTLIHGDCVPTLAAMPERSIALSVSSIPFANLFAYTRDEADMGNNRPESFWYGFRCVAEALKRAMMPGRHVCIHVTQLKAYKVLHGYMGLRDFVGDVVRVMQDAGFNYQADVSIGKNPQSVAQRFHDHNLLFATLRKDSVGNWPTKNDYLLVFGAPGDNEVPVTSLGRGEITVEDWIKWACGVWHDIHEGDVLRVNRAGGVGSGAEGDETKHVCPLQLEVIRRPILMWTNPGELVCDPFNGIGSTTHEAVKLGRRGLGIDLKPEHHTTATTVMRQLERELAAKAAQGTLFGLDAPAQAPAASASKARAKRPRAAAKVEAAE